MMINYAIMTINVAKKLILLLFNILIALNSPLIFIGSKVRLW